MQETGSLRLFKRGPAAELRLIIFVVLAIALMIVDSRWLAFEPARKAVSVAIYPFQRLVLAPRDLYEHFDSWSNAAAHHLARQSRILRSTVRAALQESLHERRVSGN